MTPLTVGHAEGRDGFLEELERFVEVCGSLSDRELLAASRCRGWAVLDVVVHVRNGLQEMLGGVVSTTGDAPDTDAASYWARPVPTADSASDDVDAVMWTRRTSSAYRRPGGAIVHLRDVVAGLVRAVGDLRDGGVRFQGHVLTTGDFLATWAVEVAVHHLDVALELDVAPPTEGSLRLTRATVEALLGRPVPEQLDDVSLALLGAGRCIPSERQARTLGDLAALLPVLG